MNDSQLPKLEPESFRINISKHTAKLYFILSNGMSLGRNLVSGSREAVAVVQVLDFGIMYSWKIYCTPDKSIHVFTSFTIASNQGGWYHDHKVSHKSVFILYSISNRNMNYWSFNL